MTLKSQKYAEHYEGMPLFFRDISTFVVVVVVVLVGWFRVRMHVFVIISSNGKKYKYSFVNDTFYATRIIKVFYYSGYLKLY